MRKILMVLALVSVLALPLFTAPVSAQTSTEVVQTRFVHALPQLGTVDIYVDSDLVVPNAEFGSSTPHFNLPAGDHVVALRQAGSDATAPALLSQTLTLVNSRPGIGQTLVVQGGASDLPEISVNIDDLNPAALGQARLNVIQTIASAGAVDVIATSGAPIAQGVAFNTPFGGVNPPVSTWDLVVVPSGSSADSAFIEIGEVDFNTGTLYTLILAGSVDSAETLLLETPLNSDASTASVKVRLAHGSSDAPAIDIYGSDNTKLFVNLQPGDVTPHVALPAGEVTLTVREAGSPPNSEALATSLINLGSSTGAASVVAVGSLDDRSFTFSIYEDTIENLSAELARVRVINTALNGAATVSLSDGTPLVDNLGVFNASDSVDVVPGVYSVVASIGDDSFELSDELFVGGTYSTILLFANQETGLTLSATGINSSVASLPGAVQGIAVAAVVVETPPSVDSVDISTPDDNARTDTGTGLSTSSEDTTTVPPAATPPPAAVVETVVPSISTNPPVQQIDNKVRGTVNLDSGVNLQCREYPSPSAFSLGLVPNGTELEIRGYAGPSDPEVETPFIPVDSEQFEDPTSAESFEDIWVSAYWTTPDGGTIDCWTRADFLLITYRNKFIREVEDFFALEELDLPVPVIQPIPFNYPGEVLDGTSITPPTPVVQVPIATVNVNSGVNLHIRRQPDATSESLALAPNGAGLVVIERTLIVGEIEEIEPVGEGTPTPTPPTATETAWLFVEYTGDNGVATRGWISSQYVALSLAGRKLELADIPVASFIQSGEVLGVVGTPVNVTPPPSNNSEVSAGPVIGVVNIPSGANLNMYDSPNINGTLVRSLGNLANVTVLGRNSDASWLHVRYEAIGEGTWVGWVPNSGGWVTLPVAANTLPVTG